MKHHEFRGFARRLGAMFSAVLLAVLVGCGGDFVVGDNPHETPAMDTGADGEGGDPIESGVPDTGALSSDGAASDAAGDAGAASDGAVSDVGMDATGDGSDLVTLSWDPGFASTDYGFSKSYTDSTKFVRFQAPGDGIHVFRFTTLSTVKSITLKLHVYQDVLGVGTCGAEAVDWSYNDAKIATTSIAGARMESYSERTWSVTFPTEVSTAADKRIDLRLLMVGYGGTYCFLDIWRGGTLVVTGHK